MVSKTITYTDYNGEKRTETFLFNLNKAELSEMELSKNGGLSEMIKKIVASNDVPLIVKIFKEILLKSYGVKSDDGRRFIKSEQLSKEFTETEAYSDLFMELSTNADEAQKFFKAIIPADVNSDSTLVTK